MLARKRIEVTHKISGHLSPSSFDRAGTVHAVVVRGRCADRCALGTRRVHATVFGIAFAQWIREGETRSLDEIASGVFRELLHLTRAALGL